MLSDLSDGGGFAFGLVFAAFVYVALIAVVVYIAYLLIRTAFLRALHSHYKSVRTFEETGEWYPEYQRKGKPLPRIED